MGSLKYNRLRKNDGGNGLSRGSPGLGPSVPALRLPITDQLAGYTRADLKADLAAGATVGVMLVPQGMAYALVAGVPPIYGLYAALAPLIVYALFGSSRQLAVGPVAMVSLLVATSVGPLAAGDTARHLELAFLLSLMSGGILLALGLARAGFLASFLSHPVLTGFTAAAAVIIGSSQLKHVLGAELDGSGGSLGILWSAVGSLGRANPVAVGFGLASVVSLVLFKRFAKRLPAALIVVAASTTVAWLLGSALGQVSIIGAIPAGLPSASIPSLAMTDVRALLPSALVIALVGYMESIAIAKSMATRHRYKVDADSELRALGLANVVGAFFQAFPTTGGLSRTAVNEQAGARTPLAGLIAATVVALVLLFLTPLFYYLPKAVLGAIILVAVAGLFDTRELRRLLKVSRVDFGVAVLTLTTTVLAGVETGILLGVAFSLAVVVQRSSRPHTAVLGRLAGTRAFRNIKRHPEAETVAGVLLFRVDASLYFANTDFVSNQILALVDSAPETHLLVLDLYAVNQIDSTAAHGLEEILRVLSERGVDTVFSGLKGPVRDVLERAGMFLKDEGPRVFPDIYSALAAQGEGEPPPSGKKGDGNLA
ncbi:MAG: SulP family sulfate permease [Rhodothermales bacterium]|jgi:SulP family sulfate permease